MTNQLFSVHSDQIAQQRGSFRVLVAIPTLGERLGTLERTLASIRGQQGIPVDIVIVCKKASPDLRSAAAHCGALIVQSDGHISEAINVGLATADESHRYMAWLGDDDMLRPDALATACETLEQNPEAVVCYGSCDYVDIDGGILFSRRPPPLAPLLLRYVPGLIKQEACLFRMSAIRSIGGLDQGLRYTMDLDLLLRLQAIGRFVRVDRVLAAFCWHPGSLTIANRRASLAEAQQVQRKQARGATAFLFPILKRPIEALIMFMSSRITDSLH